MLVAVALILAPWWLRLVRGLAAERAERIRSQERAEVAAHLHDSVLQTLALVQKRAGDPREVAGLARRQERELRAWLNGGRPAGRARHARGALEAAAAEVEEDHGVPVDVVTVGDAPLDERAAALVAAAREALVNAAKFAGPEPVCRSTRRSGRSAPRCSCATAARASTPTRCPRTGAACASRSSARMDRHGGAPSSTPAPGAGTEVELGSSASDDPRPSVVIVDDHQLFRAGVRAELDGLVEVLGDAATVEDAVRLRGRARARRRPARRADAGRRRRRGDPPGREARGPRSASSRCRSPTPPRT